MNTQLLASKDVARKVVYESCHDFSASFFLIGFGMPVEITSYLPISLSLTHTHLIYTLVFLLF